MVEYDVEAFRKRSSHYKPSSECMDERCYEQTDDSTESDTPASDIDHGDVEEALCDDIDIEPPGSDNSILQSRDTSECI